MVRNLQAGNRQVRLVRRACCISLTILFCLSMASAAQSPESPNHGPWKPPIDPVTKSTLAVVLTGLTVIAFFSIMSSIGRGRRVDGAADVGLWVHRFNGYAFIVLAIIIAQYCIRVMVISGGLAAAPVALHLVTAVPVVLIPVVKALIARRYRAMGGLLPPLGIALLLLTWVTSALIIAFFFRG